MAVFTTKTQRTSRETAEGLLLEHVLSLRALWLLGERKNERATMIADWETFVTRQSGQAEFDLGVVQPGDTLRVVTDHTDYVFEIVDGFEAQLRCSRPDRPTGRVRISGCGFAFSTTFKPGRLFCGGRLEFTFVRNNAPARYRTTSINAIFHSHQSEPARAVA